MRLPLTHVLTVTGYCQFYFIYSARCVSVTSLISTRPNSLPQWPSLRNHRNRTRLHICLDPGLHNSHICPLPLGHGCFACPQIRARFEVTILHPHDPQERPGWWQMNRAPLNSYLQRYEGASLSMFLFFLTEVTRLSTVLSTCKSLSLLYMFLMLNIFTFGIFLFKNKAGHLKCCSAQHSLCLPVW